jgi:HD-GYP domain-containing protein (c-di-GMP phosphodiesterase class II)
MADLERADPSSTTSTDGASTTAQLVAALSLAEDLGVGLPLEHTLRACYIGLHIAAELNLDADTREDVFWTVLLKDTGCTGFNTQAAAFIRGDEIAAKRQLLFYMDGGKVRDTLEWATTYVGSQLNPMARAGRVADFMINGRDFFREGFFSATEVAGRIAARLGMRPEVCTALSAYFERWDGKGMPRGLHGEAILVASRVAYASTYFEVFHHLGGRDAARRVAQSRRESAFDPAVVDAFLRVSGRPGFWGPLQSESILETVLPLKPGRPAAIAQGPDLDAVAHAFADFVDMKSPYFAGHSRRVATLASNLGRRLKLGAAETSALHRAALMHDAGFVAVPSFTVNKPPGERSRADHEEILRHPQHGETFLRPAAALAPERIMIATHHERPDGRGPRGLAWEQVPVGARVIAVVDRFDELTHDQPGALPLNAEQALRQLRAEAGTGLDPDVLRTLVDELGGSNGSASARDAWPASLTEREVEVLRLLGRGMSRREVAKELVISDATARHHLEHIYDKIGVSTRVAAVLFAMEHGLLE